MTSSSIFITTSIPYVNANPHIGHAQEFALADFHARRLRRQGFDVTFQSGADENGAKNVQAAERSGQSVQKHVDAKTDLFKQLLAALEIEPDRFVRTSSAAHKKTVQDFWRLLNPEDLYTASYEGLYCTGCEDFLDASHVGLCPDHRTEPERISEKNVFFRLSRYETQLRELIDRDTILIRPLARKNEVLGFLRGGLRDISLTRPSARTGGWGVEVPGAPDQVVYVWIDALVNYLTGAGFTSDEPGLWTESVRKVHVVGKNIVKFHAIYWPALLLSAGLPLPNEILVHGFLTCDGVKISKSLGNGVDPIAVIEKYGAASVRHYLLGVLSTETDADFSLEQLARHHDGDLANRLGNLLSRVTTLRERGGLKAGAVWRDRENKPSLVSPRDLLLADLWGPVDELNAQIQSDAPWTWIKTNDSRFEPWIRDAEKKLSEVIATLSDVCPRLSLAAEERLSGEAKGPLAPRLGYDEFI